MKRIWRLWALLLVWFPQMAMSQSFDDAFNAFASQNQQSFNHFADSINRQFAEAMEAHMKAFTGEEPKVRDPKPKPKQLPVLEDAPAPDNLPAPIPEPENKLERDKPQPESVLDKPATPSVPAENLNIMDLNLFGEPLQIVKPSFPARLNGITPKDVSDFWIRLSECKYKDLVHICETAQKQLAFNDWAVYQLVLQLAQKTYDGQYNEQAVMIVFLLNQLGIEAKVGFEESHLFCLLAFEQQLYGISYSDVKGTRYYLFETAPKYAKQKQSYSFWTYDHSFPVPTHGLDMNILRTMKIRHQNAGPICDSCIDVNMSMIELFATYPQVDIEVYANAKPSEDFSRSIDRLIKPYLADLSTFESVSLLLAYLQYGFEYATDDEQFGCEKPFFCEENYYYAKNDCEDRSILFSYLVRHLLHLDVVLVDYPGHLATAVYFPIEVGGESVIYNGKRYVICDPTYIGASIGVEMPEYTAKDRTIIPLKRL